MVLKLVEMKRWIENVIQHARLLKPDEEFSCVRAAEKPSNVDSIQRTGPKIFWDVLFLNDVTILVRQTVQAYRSLVQAPCTEDSATVLTLENSTNSKTALNSGLYGFTVARDSYRAATHAASIEMHHECVRHNVEYQALMVCVVAPH